MTRGEAIERFAFEAAAKWPDAIALGMRAAAVEAGDLDWTDERLAEGGFAPLTTAEDFSAWHRAYDRAVEELIDDDDRDDNWP